MPPGGGGIGGEEQLAPVIPAVHVQDQSIPAGLVDLVDPGADAALPNLIQHRG